MNWWKTTFSMFSCKQTFLREFSNLQTIYVLTHQQCQAYNFTMKQSQPSNLWPAAVAAADRSYTLDRRPISMRNRRQPAMFIFEWQTQNTRHFFTPNIKWMKTFCVKPAKSGRCNTKTIEESNYKLQQWKFK